MRFWWWISRAAVVVLVAKAASIARVAGGGADARAPLPMPDANAGGKATGLGGSRSSDPGGAQDELSEVKLRLTEALAEASIDVPSLAASQPFFQGLWRKVRGPWVRPPGTAGQLVTSIALRTSTQAETQWEVATQAGQTWTPDVRVWNMNEGSFDQREALYAPTPATLRFRTTLPRGARLRFSPAVATWLPATTVFDVSVVDAAGVERSVWTTRITPAQGRRWLEADADLAPWSAQTVELKLRTWTEKAEARGPMTTRDRDLVASAGGRPSPEEGGAERTPVPPMALALWGDPVVVGSERPRAPYNVLWIVVDALRPDVAAALHDAADDSAKLGAARPPLDALLPVIPGLMPSVDRLASRGVQFTHAWSAASWTRPGTLAMLTGERSSEVGIDTTNWVQPPDRIARYYASKPPLVPRLLRGCGMTTAAFVNNFFMTGYANVGLDMGFERITDHRYRTRDTALITYGGLQWLEAHARDRFFLFINYNSPHEPYDPPKEMLARIPPAPLGPRDGQVRDYMAEAAKDDVGIGVLLDKLDALGLTRSTLVVVTADHGETLSSAHDGVGSIGQDRVPMRFHHAVGNFEETTRVPLVMSLPGVADGGRAVRDRVRSIDVAPTILELEGLDRDPRMSGRSLLGLLRGSKEAEPRVVVSEGRQSRAVLWGKWRLISHDPALHPASLPDGGKPPTIEDELFNLDDDPGERRSVARQNPDVVAEMRARLASALLNTRPADAPLAATPPLPTVRLRFAGAGAVHHVGGTLTAGDAVHPALLTAKVAGIAPDAVRVDGPRIDFTLSTSPDAPVGFDVQVDPAGASLTWSLMLDDAPWPRGATFAGPFGLPAAAALTGVADDDARSEAYSPALPTIDPGRDMGVFVTRDRADAPDHEGYDRESASAGPAQGGEGAKEMQRVLEEWGYARGSH